MEVDQSLQEHQHVKDGFIDITAGSLGGIAVVYVGQPLDTVKVKMQTFPTLYKNMVECFMRTFKSDGIVRGLYAGTVPALATNIAENSVLFFAYGFCQKFMVNVTGASNIDSLSVVSNATAGFLASFFSSLAICPTELIKCKLQAMHETNKQLEAQGKKVTYIGPGQLTAKIIRLDGIRGLFKGLTPTIVREMPGYFFFFGAYEGTRELFRKPNQKKEDIGLLKTMVAGGTGGAVFWTMLFPADVVKSRIQVGSLNDNMFVLIFRIIRQEGIGALYNGLTPTLVRAIPATATMFVTIEYSKKWMYYLLRDF